MSTDKELVKKYLNGDETSLGLLVERYLTPVYRFAYGYVRDKDIAEDITQETFVKVWKHLKKFDTSKPFKTWVLTIVKRTALDHLRKKKLVPFSTFDTESGGNSVVDTLADTAPSIIEQLSQEEDKNTVIKMLNSLSDKYRHVLHLRYYAGLNFREIGERLGESLNTVKSRHRRALASLKKTSK